MLVPDTCQSHTTTPKPITTTTKPKRITDCTDIRDVNTKATSGIYTISPTEGAEVEVFCNMEIDGGGWTVGLI